MKIGILRTTSSLKADAVARHVSTALAQRGETVVHLLSSGEPAAEPVQGNYPNYRVLQGGVEAAKTAAGKVDSLATNGQWVVFEVSVQQGAAAIEQLASNADQLLLCYEDSPMSLNSLTELLQPLAKLKQANQCPPIRACLVTKESQAEESIKELDAACGTLATIQNLYPALHKVGSLSQTEEFIQAVQQDSSVIAKNPTNPDAEIFRTIASDLAPGEKGDGVVRRALKRHSKGKPPAPDSLFDLMQDKLQSLFGK